MTNEVQQTNAFFLNRAKNTITVKGREFPIEYDNWTKWQESGFRWRTYKYKGVKYEGIDNPGISDGADIEVKDGGHTPAQMFVTRRNGEIEFYWEQPLEGDLTLLYLTKDGKVKTEAFNSKTLGKQMMTVQPGMIMCWFGGRTESGISHIQESEYPGFDEQDLATVPYRASFFNGIKVPIEFWDEFDQLTTERKLGAPRKFDENGNYTEEFIQWWAKQVGVDPNARGIRLSIEAGVNLHLTNLRAEINDVVQNILYPVAMQNIFADDLQEMKIMFIMRAKKRYDSAIIDGGISRQEVKELIKYAEEMEWCLKNIKKLYKRWGEISKPQDQRKISA